MSTGTLVIGLFENAAQSDSVLATLYKSGYSASDLSILAGDDRATEAFSIVKRSRVGEGAAIGAGVAGALGAAIAGFAAVGAIATGGAGLVLAGPLVAALAGAGAGAAAGGVIGGLVGLGIPEHEVQYWSDQMQRGSVLVGVRCRAESVEQIKSIFERHGALRITTQAINLDAPAAGKSVNGTAGGAPATGNQMSADQWKTKSPMHGLFVDQLRDIYYAEHKLLDALGTLEAKAGTPELAEAIREHRGQTQDHISRLAQVFESIGVKPEMKACPAINGIIAEAQELAKFAGDGREWDAALICAAQKAEHYEIGTYGCLRTYASTLGLSRAATLLERTLDEEWEADRRLTQIAESGVNQEAVVSAH